MCKYEIKTSAMIMVLLCAMSAEACWDAINMDIRQPGEYLIHKTKDIVLAKVVKKEAQGSVKELVTYHFQIIRALKGNAVTRFYTTLYETEEYSTHTSFNNHTDETFWKNRLGRIGYPDETCSRPIPKFIVGKTYLLFKGSDDSKAYELIEDEKKDKWYIYVANTIKEN